MNAVSLGVIKTPTHDEDSYAGMAALHPLGRLGEVSDVVDGILYLERATFVTGRSCTSTAANRPATDADGAGSLVAHRSDGLVDGRWPRRDAAIVPAVTMSRHMADVSRRAGWLPMEQDDLESWLAGHSAAGGGQSASRSRCIRCCSSSRS